MTGDGYDFPVFSSGSPVINQLFASEFAVRNARQQALQQAAVQETARAQIAAQSQLAQAQLQSNSQNQQNANLFRMQELTSREKSEKERNRILEKEIDARVPRTDLEAERRKAAIIDANSNAVNDAARANAMLRINIESAVALAKKDLPWGAGNLGGTSAVNLDDPKHPVRRAIEKAAFDTVRNQLLAEKGGALNSLIPDADTFTFRPVQYDETGKAIALPLPAAGGGGTNDLGTAAGLGTTPVVAPVVTPAVANPAALGQTAVPESKSSLFGIPSPISDSLFGVKAPVVATSAKIQVPIDEASAIEMSSEDAAEAARQLRSVPPEQVPAVAAAIRDGLIKSGRARIVVRHSSPMQELLKSSPVPLSQ